MTTTLQRIEGAIGLTRNAVNRGLVSTREKIAASLDLRDNPAIQIAGQYGQQQPSAALPQLTENLTQLALKQVSEALNKSTAINDPMEAENERLRRQKENLTLQLDIQEKTQQLQAAQQPQQPQGGMPPGGDPSQGGGQPQGAGGPMDAMGGPDQAAMMGGMPPGGGGGQGGQMPPQDYDIMEQLRNAVQAGPIAS
jgi:hypothetical protein